MRRFGAAVDRQANDLQCGGKCNVIPLWVARHGHRSAPVFESAVTANALLAPSEPTRFLIVRDKRESQEYRRANEKQGDVAWANQTVGLCFMKNMRASGLCFLLALVLCLVSGCATTSHDSYTAADAGSKLEEKQPSPTKEMTPVETAGYYLGWLSLSALYVWAGGNPASSQ
jgi:hypothetical protein